MSSHGASIHDRCDAMDRNRMASRVIRARIPPDGSQYLGDSAELQDNRGAAGITETPANKNQRYRVSGTNRDKHRCARGASIPLFTGPFVGSEGRTRGFSPNLAVTYGTYGGPFFASKANAFSDTSATHWPGLRKSPCALRPAVRHRIWEGVTAYTHPQMLIFWRAGYACIDVVTGKGATF